MANSSFYASTGPASETITSIASSKAEIEAAGAAAQASADAAAETLSTLQSLQVATGPSGSNASYNPETGVLTVPRGDEGDQGESGTDTADDILTKLLTVDGTTSNLDADKLDGQDGSYYLNTSSALDAGSF